MNFNSILLVFFSVSLLYNAFFIVRNENTIYSIFLLVFLFVLSSGLLFLIESEFIALIFLIIYVGAISVLFLFVILMLDLKTNKSSNNKYFYNALILIFFFSVVILILNIFSINYYSNSFLFNFNVNWFYKIECLTDLSLIGQILYTHYVIQFLILGIILILAIIGVVSLTFNHNILTNQNIFRQISR